MSPLSPPLAVAAAFKLPPDESHTKIPKINPIVPEDEAVIKCFFNLREMSLWCYMQELALDLEMHLFNIVFRFQSFLYRFSILFKYLANLIIYGFSIIYLSV